MQQESQKSPRLSQEPYLQVQIADCVKGRYTYLVLIVDLNWLLLSSQIAVKAYSGKSHLLMNGTETTHANVDSSMIKSSQKEILLGINLDSELKFEDHVSFMC